MNTTLKYLSAFGLVLVFVFMFGVTSSRAVDDRDFGAVRVDRDLLTYFSGGPNEFGDDMAVNNASGARDADIAAHPPKPFTWGLGVCGGVRCKRNGM